ncbi:MAG: amidase [Chloroflexi bacterium]|nr:amidase [Chloroflexota bacterium]
MTPTHRTTAGLFREAVDIVRTWPLDPADRKPAFVLPTVPAEPVPDGHGAVEGLDGDIWDTIARLRAGAASVAHIAREATARIAAYARTYGVFEFEAEVGEEAAQLDAEARAGAFRGPLHGVPISVKDVIDVAGMPTGGSSQALTPRLPKEDATAVARLRGAGALIVGKVATHEFALGVTTPQSRNPWEPSRVPGGSSGGSAISLVTGMALGSLGTDTRASIRVPAAVCGLVGYKPSFGLIPTDRWLTLSWSLDHFAPMARSVRDIALMTDILAATPGRFTRMLPTSIAGRRVGYTESALAGAQPDVVERFRESLRLMERAGAQVLELEAPSASDTMVANATGMVLSRAEAAAFHGEIGTDLDRCSPEVREQLRAAAGLHATDYIRGLRLRGQLRDRLAGAIAGVDVLAMPTCKVVAPLREEADDYLLVLSENCIAWSLVDFPAISLSMGQADGLPCGIQFVAAPGQDDRLLAAAYGFERLAPAPPAWRPE